ncbi:LysR family transcriptional regulator [Roseomonas sp. SSH11]|uniref:LysR family transcriptional regulator n=1 Tax=Pararoseomonas baculiformis TaxID=2820812 RepID=A0ABS4ACT5_9PROT|nr:LysR family transcriptional regulator [Pararoseomonas baculiformis]MBP0444808.1 LysR family transcriptional regulator [Pararoseomonas baculiformis]
MDVSIRQARALVAVVRLGSLTRAAQALGVSQPTLTVQLRGLEEALGLTLLDRGVRGSLPTAEGQRLAEAFGRLVGDFDLLVGEAREVAAQRAGLVRLAALPSVGTTVLPEALARLRAASPGIRVLIRDAVAHRIGALVKAGEVELAIGTDMGPEPELRTELLLRDRMVAVLPGGHALAGGSIPPERLAREPLILTDPQSSVRVLVERCLSMRGLPVSPAYEVTYMSTAIGLVRAGLGVAILPSSAVDAALAPAVVAASVDAPELEREVLLIRRAGRSLSPPARALAEALRLAARGGG